MEIKINERFKGLIRPLQKEELETLEQNVLRDGLREALIVWNGQLVDGHNRLEICKKHDIEPRLHEMEFEDEDAACVWIIRNQLGRRNLTTIERVQLALQLEPMLRAKAKENQATGKSGKGKPLRQISAKAVHVKTREQIAKAAGVSQDTVSKAKAVLESGDNELINQVVSKEKSLNQAAKEVKAEKTKPVDEVNERAERARQEAEKDSEKLWALKRAWKRAGKTDREQFMKWLKE